MFFVKSPWIIPPTDELPALYNSYVVKDDPLLLSNVNHYFILFAFVKYLIFLLDLRLFLFIYYTINKIKRICFNKEKMIKVYIEI